MPLCCIQNSHDEDGEKAGQDRVGYVSAIAAMLWARNELCTQRVVKSAYAAAVDLSMQSRYQQIEYGSNKVGYR